MEGLLNKQEAIAELIIKNFTNYKKSPKERVTKAYIEVRTENLEKSWNEFTDNNFQLVALVKWSDRAMLKYFSEEMYDNTEEIYITYKTKLKEDLESLTKHASVYNFPSATPVSSATEIKLPRIQLPTFSGVYEEWQTFYDMFVSLIHDNQTLSAVQKLHYLKSSLSGEPDVLLRDLSTIGNNYDEAWKKLIKRYNNKRYNANEILKRLFSQKNSNTESASAIKHLLDTTTSCIKALKNLGINTDSWDVLINYLVVSKLDYESRRQWEIEVCHVDFDDLPTWEQLVKFLEMRFRTLEMMDGVKTTAKSVQSNVTKQVSKQKSFHSTVSEEKKENNKLVCAYCSSQHLLYQCKQFGSKSPEERSEFVQSKGHCFNCLSPNHNVRGCHQATCCRRCGRRHHTLLHFERGLRPEATASSASTEKSLSQESSTQKNIIAHFAQEENQSEVLLATALVRAKSADGYSQIVRVLIDQGSEASFISESTVQSLGLKKIPVNGLVSGVGDGQSRIKSMVVFDLESLHDSEFSIRVNAFVLSSLTSFLPSSKTSVMNWSEVENLPLADPKYGQPSKIDVIVGVEVHSEIMLNGLLRHPSKMGPIAQNTKLGWILSGRMAPQELTNTRMINLHLQVKEDLLLKQFWEIEREPDMLGKPLTKEEIKCEEIYEETTVRNDEGRYVVRLPFKKSDPEVRYGKSKEIAYRRYQLLERRLMRNPSLKKEYRNVLEDYIQQNHMEKIENREDIENPLAVYLPHHAVVREDKETTKVRVVFDASCKGVNNVSLNDSFLIGPKLQQDLRHILMRWRLHPYCIVADLKQMYRQVLVNEQDTDFQRILWRQKPEGPIEHFRLLRLTFGTSCAPYLAVKSLQQVAKDEQEKYPEAAKITREDYYMDDLLTGCQTETDAIEIYEQMTKLMEAGGFHLQKWCSNSPKLLDHIERDKQRTDHSFIFKASNMIKVLGITWNKISDNFEYSYNLPEQEKPITKRKVLSDIARLYDPLGWIAPTIIIAKIFIQRLWQSGLAWDDDLTPELLDEWHEFRSSLNEVNKINIPRWLQTTNNDMRELHVFADASQRAYAAAVYLKCKGAEDVYVSLLTAKTKVAPIEKEISIPRMELCAAVLATKLIHEVSQIMRVPKTNLYAWSDSTVVLAWLRGEPSRWATFVSNRVSEILTVLDRDQWNHVKTDQNPADCASRGMSIAELTVHNLWWNGPAFLRYQNEYKVDHGYETNEEERPKKTLAAVVQIKEEFIWERFSSLSKLLRVLSYCRKFLKLKIPKGERIINKIVSTEESKTVLQICIKKTQELYFQEELKQLKSYGEVLKRSVLHTLSPFLDGNDTLRVGGRINQGQEDFAKKHPVILPSDSHITKLIILDAHIKTLHGGPQLMLNFLRARFWIIRARERVKKCYRECTTCTRYARQNNQQLMGQLPECRLVPDKPFRKTGVDFTGHVNLRFSPGRGAKSYKGYICVYICMVTRAIHLEAVSDLTATGFIAAFRRFVARRGYCEHLYSDNGTNFVGAEKELREMLTRAKSQLSNEIVQLLANEGTSWHFIPPNAPNFGGLWEAGVRSTKAHLKRVVGDATLTFEELSTVLAQIEACLNSRPISILSDNPDDPLPLTPGHFLVGEPLVTVPDENYSEMSISSLHRWKLTQKMLNDFWRRWSDEYIVNLNQRFKWTTKRLEPEINDVVIVRDHNIPPAKWLLARVIEKHPGKDGITRVVTIKTKNGIVKRPCSKLCVLPKPEN